MLAQKNKWRCVMEFILFGVAAFFFITIWKASTTSQKEIDDHNTKVTLEKTLNDAYRNNSSSRLKYELTDLESRYNDLVDLGVKRYKSRYPDTSNKNGALFLGFERVFSVEEFAIITKYEAILKAVNEKLPVKDKKASSYQGAISYLEFIYHIYDPSEYIDF